LLLPLATFLMWVANGLRIAGLILIGTYGWRDIALGGFHSQAGWLAFNAISIGLIAIANKSHFFSGEASTDPQQAEDHAASGQLMPLLALVATIMVTSAISVGFDWAYPVRVIVVAFVLWLYRGAYSDLRCSWSWTAVAIGIAVMLVWILLEPRG